MSACKFGAVSDAEVIQKPTGRCVKKRWGARDAAAARWPVPEPVPSSFPAAPPQLPQLTQPVNSRRFMERLAHSVVNDV